MHSLFMANLPAAVSTSEHGGHPLRSSANLIGLTVCALLIFIFAFTAHRAWLGKCATFDEPTHFVASILQCQQNDFRADPENPPLWRYYVGGATPTVIIDQANPLWPELLQTRAAEGAFVRQTLYSTPANDPDALITRARFRMIALGCVVGIAIAWWAWRLAGPIAAIIATAAFCLDPNFLANAPIVKNDVPIALCLLLLLATVWLLGEKINWPRCLSAILFACAAVGTKSSGFIAIPLLAITLLARALMPEPWPIFTFSANTRLKRAVLAIALPLAILPFAWISIWASYHFRFAPTPDADLHFNLKDILQTLARADWAAAHGGNIWPPADLTTWTRDWHPQPTVRLALWALHHHILPETPLVGFMHLYGVSQIRVSFLLGKTSTTGWWYYFPLAFIFKTPLATLIALIISIGYWVKHRRQRPTANHWPIAAASIGPLLYLLAAMASHVSVGLRHILLIYPFLFIFLGVTTAHALRNAPKIATSITAILLLGLAAETCCAYPDFIPFFNVAFGGTRNGIHLLGDSNLDGGQELPALAAWQRQNPDRQLYLCYFGTADPRYYGIHYVNLPSSMAPPDETTPAALSPVAAISAPMLQDPLVPEPLRTYFRALQNRRPIVVLGGSIYLYSTLY